MHKQNRVDPRSQLHAVAARGSFMGNRGRLHNAEQNIVRQRDGRRWIVCLLSFDGRQRKLMGDGYTELFFLDEATAYAAGHRPCAECRRADYNRYRAIWAQAFPQQQDLSAEALDKLLHAARLNADGSQRRWTAVLAELPDGCMIEHDGQCILLWHGRQWLWSFEGYSPLRSPVSTTEVSVLTPEPIVALLRHGLADTLQVHPSMDG